MRSPLRVLGDVVDGPGVEAFEVILEVCAAPELEGLSCVVGLIKVAWLKRSLYPRRYDDLYRCAVA